MLTILKTLLKWFKGGMEELKPETRFLLSIEIGFYLLLGFVIFIWQPEWLGYGLNTRGALGVAYESLGRDGFGPLIAHGFILPHLYIPNAFDRDMNSGEIGFILFIVLFIGFVILKVIRSGELGEILSFMKMMKTSQDDIFDEEGKSFRAQIDGKEVTLHIRTMMDFWKQTEDIRESAKIYLEETGKMGRNLDLRFTSSQGDDWLEIRYFAGEEILRTEKINLDKEGPFKASSFVEEVFKETTPEGEEWWN